MYPEPVDEVIASEQVIDQELERMVSSGLVECENIKRPLIHFLEQDKAKQNSLHTEIIISPHPSGHELNTISHATRQHHFHLS